MNTFSNIFKKSFLEGFGGSDITTVRILVTLAGTCALALYIMWQQRRPFIPRHLILRCL